MGARIRRSARLAAGGGHGDARICLPATRRSAKPPTAASWSAGSAPRLLCAYLYADAGHGESTTDMTFAGHNLIAENGSLLADTAPFAGEDAVTELDLGRMVQERQRNTTFMPETDGYTTVEFELPPVEFALTRPVSCTPFVPQDAATRTERCELILRIQAEGLAKRMEHTHAKCGVIGISGGLDSARLALLVAVRACKVLGRDPKDIIARDDALLRHDEAHPLQRRDSVRGSGRDLCAKSTSPRPSQQPFCRHRPARRQIRRHL